MESHGNSIPKQMRVNIDCSLVPELEILNINRPSNTKLQTSAAGEASSHRKQKWPLQWGCTFTITFTGMYLVRELSSDILKYCNTFKEY